jgi:S1-C subfamily serine protease
MTESPPARLIFLTGSRAGTGVDLSQGLTTIGRSADRTIPFSADELLVSTEHATIEFRDGRYLLREDGSRNGTFVNGEQVWEREMADGDMIMFGAGGPTARFSIGTQHDTVDVVPSRRRTHPSMAMPAQPWARSTPQVLALALGRLRLLTLRRLILLAGLGALTAVGVAGWQQWRSIRLEQRFAELSSLLGSEQAFRTTLERNLATVGARADSLQRLLAAGSGSVPRGVGGAARLRELARGVVLIVFTYGFVEPSGNELLRYVVDERGQVIVIPTPEGRGVPAIRFGGSGPVVQRGGTATGFLVDAGRILTNRHVAEPWAYDDELNMMRAHGISAVGRMLQMEAYFPPGDRSFPLVVDALSGEADVALMRLPGVLTGIPVVPLAPRTALVGPGDRLRLIGYPTGAYNLLFRVDDTTRAAILSAVGEDTDQLIKELARRRLIQPLITDGSVSDTTGLEVIHTAATTVGGSGGPLLDESAHVVAIQHASVLSPQRGDPFRTQRAVPVRFAWAILPKVAAVRR